MSILNSKAWPQSLDLLHTVSIEAAAIQSISFKHAQFETFALDTFTNTLMMEFKLTLEEDVQMLASIQTRFERTFHKKYKLFHPLVQTKIVNFLQLDPERFRVLAPQKVDSIRHIHPGDSSVLEVRFAGFTSTSVFNVPVFECVHFRP